MAHTLPEVRCPDCSGWVAEGVAESIKHDDSCPTWPAYEAMKDADRTFFQQHPNAVEYWREAMPGDFGITSLESVMVFGRVRVVRMDNADYRMRYLPEVALIVGSASSEYLLGVFARIVTLPQDVWDNLEAHRAKKP